MLWGRCTFVFHLKKIVSKWNRNNVDHTQTLWKYMCTDALSSFLYVQQQQTFYICHLLQVHLGEPVFQVHLGEPVLQVHLSEPVLQVHPGEPAFQVHPGEPMLSQRRDLLEQPLDFYEPDVLPATQPIVSKHYRKTQWFGRIFVLQTWYHV